MPPAPYRLAFRLPFCSIKSFPEVELPPLAIVTGINGVGKTHLLKAIQAGHVATSLWPSANAGQPNPPPDGDVRFFDWTTLVPNAAEQANSHLQYKQRDGLVEYIERARTQHAVALANDLGLDLAALSDIWDTVRLSVEELRARVGPDVNAEEISTRARRLAAGWSNELATNHGVQGRNLFDYLRRHNAQEYPILATREDIDRYPFAWHVGDQFQQSFADLFLRYFELMKENKLRRLDHQEGKGLAPVSEEEFQRIYGEPPWDFVNRALADAGLDFEIDHPVSYTTVSFTPRLTKRSSGDRIDFGSLSSGEKILMSLAFCVYYTADARNVIKRPKLVLFDEIDAPLHPSMSRTLLRVIEESIVGRAGASVIFATHSPSTVAVAREDSIYLMKPGEPGLHKVRQRQAIAALTRELPTLSIQVDGRRQVFVESGYDVARYDLLYRALAPQLGSERSLTFISAGAGAPSNHEGDGGGSTYVKRIVGDLVKNGNTTVFGVVDWDGTNVSRDGVFVLAEGMRHSAENCALDPVLLLSLILREREGVRLGLPAEVSYLRLDDFGADVLQPAIDRLQRIVLSVEPDAELVTKEVAYAGPLRLQLSVDYLEYRGHDLEAKVKEAFPSLRRFHQANKLAMAALEVAQDRPHLIPKEVLELFEKLLSAEES